MVQSLPIVDDEVNPEELGEYLEGDIVVVNTRNGVLNGSLRWGEGVVPFVIDDAHLRDSKKMIIDAMEQYHKKTCIRSVNKKKSTTVVQICFFFVLDFAQKQTMTPTILSSRIQIRAVGRVWGGRVADNR